MKHFKALLFSFTLATVISLLSGCENTHVSGSVSYGMSTGYGYPMYYGGGYPRHSNVVVVKPPRRDRVRNKPAVRPARNKRR